MEVTSSIAALLEEARGVADVAISAADEETRSRDVLEALVEGLRELAHRAA